MSQLQIAPGLSLPREIVTETVAILAKRRVGKSYTMRRIVEQLLKVQQQIVIVDPKGDQWGVRSSADGKSPGFPVLILGGGHGDLPLEVNGGEVVAKLVVEQRVSILLDISLFRKSEVAVFMAVFLENLYRLKAQEQYRTPVMLVIDEADAIAPQKPQHGEERMLGAAEDIVRRGGQRGIGCILVTQRSAVLNKNVLTQAQMLVALRTIAPQDLTAMKAWIDVHGTAEQRQVLMDSLPALPIGDAWFWSPGWPTEEGIFRRAHVSPIETFDSAATPKPGEKKIIPRNLADVDLEALKGQMAATIEKAKKDDPTVLRKEITRLQGELAKQPEPKQVRDSIGVRIERIEVPAIGKRTLVGLKKAEVSMRRILAAAREANKQTTEHLAVVEKCFGTFSAELMKAEQRHSHSPTRSTLPPEARVAPVERTAPRIIPDPQDGLLSSPEQQILNAVRWMECVGTTSPEQTLVATLAGYSVYSSSFIKALSLLRGKTFIASQGKKVWLTEEGSIKAQEPQQPPTEGQLHQRLLDKLDGPSRKIMSALLSAEGKEVADEELAVASTYSPLSSSYIKAKSVLRGKDLMESNGKMHKARSILFL
jgi:hypothetical protein